MRVSLKGLRPAGQIVSEFLSGCWRSAPPPLPASPADLERVAPLILDPHIAALVWRRIQNTELQSSPLAQSLLQAARLTVMRNAYVRSQIKVIVEILRAEAIEPILMKGWASARWYGCPELRGYGDVDLLVRPRQLSAAKSLLSGRADVDLDHYEFEKRSETAIEDIFEHAQLVDCNGYSVRVLGAEDHLSMLCLHFGRHLAAYAVGLCDIAAALESLPAGFDWKRFLGTSARDAHWTECCLRLAQELLGARVEHPVQIPRWLVPAVYEQWSTKLSPVVPIGQSSNRPLKALLDRWPSPLKATLLLGARIDNAPRLPYQALWFAGLAWSFLRQSLGPIAKRDTSTG
jgi:Uncharacterised nucleotidyltransferase